MADKYDGDKKKRRSGKSKAPLWILSSAFFVGCAAFALYQAANVPSLQVFLLLFLPDSWNMMTVSGNNA